jgi:hypothetical protein
MCRAKTLCASPAFGTHDVGISRRDFKVIEISCDGHEKPDFGCFSAASPRAEFT